MTEKQTFTDVGPMWKILVLVGGIALLVGIVWLVIAGNMSAGIKWSIFAVLILVAPAAAFLGYNLTTHRTVSCDSGECWVSAGKNWGKPQIESFKWSDVTVTGIVSQVIHHSKGRTILYYFGVGIGDREIRLLRNGTEDFARLMKLAAEKTPHLSYLWVERKDVMNRLILLEVGNFCKVSRN